MKLSQLLVLPILVLVLIGCEQVTSNHPVGDYPIFLKADEWNGKWGLPFEKEFMQLEVIDPENGMLKIIPYDSKGRRETVEDVFLRLVNGWTFASVANHNSDGGYLFARIRNAGGRMLFVWLPDYAGFREVVEKGVLPGKTDDGTVSLGLLLPTHLQLITSKEHGALFKWDDPLVLIRLDRESPAGGNAWTR